MVEVLLAVLALGAGLAAGWLAARRRAEAERREAQERQAALDASLREAEREREVYRARLEALQESVAQHRATEEQLAKRLEDAFANLSRRALSQNSEEFVKSAAGELDRRREAIEAMLTPFREQLGKLEQGTRDIEARREKAYGALHEQITRLGEQTLQLTRQSESLRTALRGGHQARGRWGEVALHNIAELAGMTEHCDFVEQQAVADGSRPDMIVRLPNDGAIPVDSKVPLSAYLEAVECDDPDRRRQLLRDHASALRHHVRQLARRDYAGATASAVDVTVLFVPGDAILAAAFEADPELQTAALRERILIATPVTLVALLRTVAIYWQQVAVADGAQRMWDVAREYHKRVTAFVGEHFVKLGKGLERAIKSYNDAVGSYGHRVLPQGRKIEELDGPATGSRTLPELQPVELTPRQVLLDAADGDAPGADEGAGPAAPSTAREAADDAAAGAHDDADIDDDSGARAGGAAERSPRAGLFAAEPPRSGYSIPDDVRRASRGGDR